MCCVWPQHANSCSWYVHVCKMGLYIHTCRGGEGCYMCTNDFLNTFKCVCEGVYDCSCLPLCVCFCVLFVHLLHIWTLWWYLFKRPCVCVKKKSKESQSLIPQGFSNMFDVYFVLFWPAKRSERSSCLELGCNRNRKSGDKTSFSLDGVWQEKEKLFLYHCAWSISSKFACYSKLFHKGHKLWMKIHIFLFYFS